MASLRRTRFVCISDTHNASVKLPPGDVLIHAGDLTNQGSYSELSKTVQWLEKANFEAKIVVAGNHDITLDENFYSQYGLYFHNQAPQDPRQCQSLLNSSPTITYLCHESRAIQLRSPTGPRTTFTIFGSPYSPERGMWAFAYTRSPSLVAPASPLLDSVSSPAASASSKPNLARDTDLWSQIPLDTDIVVTHTPPHTHCDESPSVQRAIGCEALRRALWRVRPRLAVCGHVHEGRGADRVLWDVDGRARGMNTAYAEAGVERWTDPGAGAGNAKLSLVDLTARGGRVALRNDGSRTPGSETLRPASSQQAALSAGRFEEPPGEFGGQMPEGEVPRYDDRSGRVDQTMNLTPADPGVGIMGLGGYPASPRCDREALLGRMGRRETCVVNCAIMANSYPHTGGKRFNKPIVVDLDLPIWDGS